MSTGETMIIRAPPLVPGSRVDGVFPTLFRLHYNTRVFCAQQFQAHAFYIYARPHVGRPTVVRRLFSLDLPGHRPVATESDGVHEQMFSNTRVPCYN